MTWAHLRVTEIKMVPDIYFGSVPPGLYALWLNNTHSKSGGGGGDPPFFHDKQGKNNPINRQQIRKII